MSNKFLIAVGTAFFFVFVMGIAAVVSVNLMNEQTTVASQQATTQPAEAPLPVSPALAPQSGGQPTSMVSTSVKAAVSPQNSYPPVPVPVLDSDLVKLAAAVKLGAANTGDVSKEVWARETPIAEKLLQGLCDCDQRNWLNHFVKTGHEAISGSENYYQSVQLLATLRRSNQELSAAQASH